MCDDPWRRAQVMHSDGVVPVTRYSQTPWDPSDDVHIFIAFMSPA